MPLSSNGLFHFKTQDGCTCFFSQAKHQNTHYTCFARNIDIIPDDDVESCNSLHTNPSDLHKVTGEKSRELLPSITPKLTRKLTTSLTADLTRYAPIIIPHIDSDSTPLKSSPTQLYSLPTCLPTTEEDSSIIITWRKKAELLA